MEERIVDKRELLEKLLEAFNEREWDVYEEYLADDVTVHDGDDVRQGIDAFMELTKDFTTAYPDAQIAVQEMMASGNQLAARVDITGTSTDSQSGENLQLAGIVHGRVDEGEIVEVWTLTD